MGWTFRGSSLLGNTPLICRFWDSFFYLCTPVSFSSVVNLIFSATWRQQQKQGTPHRYCIWWHGNSLFPEVGKNKSTPHPILPSPELHFHLSISAQRAQRKQGTSHTWFKDQLLPRPFASTVSLSNSPHSPVEVAFGSLVYRSGK